MLKTHHYHNTIPGFSVDTVSVFSPYGADMQRKIKRFKFVHNHVDRVYFEKCFGALFLENPPTGTYITYPPIRFIDRIFRGPNHAAHLAKIVSKITNIPLICPWSKKWRAGHQSQRSKKDRTQVRTEFSFHPPKNLNLQDTTIILIDDLITTGHTADTLARLLKNAGVKRVEGYFLASEKV